MTIVLLAVPEKRSCEWPGMENESSRQVQGGAALILMKKQPWLLQPCWICAFGPGYAEERKEEGGKWPTI